METSLVLGVFFPLKATTLKIMAWAICLVLKVMLSTKYLVVSVVQNTVHSEDFFLLILAFVKSMRRCLDILISYLRYRLSCIAPLTALSINVVGSFALLAWWVLMKS